jgi:hypothetical protein
MKNIRAGEGVFNSHLRKQATAERPKIGNRLCKSVKTRAFQNVPRTNYCFNRFNTY